MNYTIQITVPDTIVAALSANYSYQPVLEDGSDNTESAAECVARNIIALITNIALEASINTAVVDARNAVISAYAGSSIQINITPTEA